MTTFQISGPFHYPNDVHPCFRVETPAALVALVFIQSTAERCDLVDAMLRAKAIAAALERMAADPKPAAPEDWTA